MIPRWTIIQRRLGGRRAFSWRIFALSSPGYIFGFVLNEPDSYSSVPTAAIVLLIAFAGQVVMGVIFSMGYLVFSGKRRAQLVPLWALGLVWSSAALLRLATMLEAMALLGIENGIPVAVRIITSLVITLASFGIATYAMDALDEFRETRALALAALLDHEEKIASHRDAISSMSSTLISEIDNELSESHTAVIAALDDLESSLSTTTESAPKISDLRILSDQTWRDISVRLSQSSRRQAPRIRTLEILSHYVQSSPFSTPFLLLAAVIFYSLIYSRAYGFLDGLVLTVMWLAFSWLAARTLTMVTAKASFSKAWLVIPAVFLYLASGLIIVALGETLGFVLTNPFAVVSVHFLTAVAALSVTFPASMSLAQEDVLRNLKNSLNEITLEALHVESQVVVLSQKIAQRLHGDVRGNFLAATLNLQRHLDSGEIGKAQDVITVLRSSLTNGVDVIPQEGESLRELESFVKNWSGVVDIQLDVPLSRIPSVFRQQAHVIIVDAINDAVRHGHASWIRVSITLDSGALALAIANNGKSLGKNPSGLGTSHLDNLAPNNWLRFTDGSNITQLLVRLESPQLAAKH
jgi:signal transduction histidine kinase